MNYAIVGISVITLFFIVRIVALNREIETLGAATAKYLAIVRSPSKGEIVVSPTQSQDAQEAVIEYLWLKNAVDEKRESRTIWFGGTLILLICLAAAIVSATS